MSVPCCIQDDVDRFVDLISAAIAGGQVEKFRQFPSSRYTVPPAIEREYAHESGPMNMDGLAGVIFLVAFLQEQGDMLC